MQDFLSAVQLGDGHKAESIVMGMDFVCAIVESGQVKVSRCRTTFMLSSRLDWIVFFYISFFSFWNDIFNYIP